MNSLLQSNCVNAAAAGNSQNSLTLRCDCVTAAAPSLGPYDCVLLPGLYGWATAWLLLLLHWGRITAICRLDYGRLRDCCCCFIGAVWLRYVVWTMGDCVTAAAASLGPYDCVMLSGLWATAWLLLLLHWGRMTAFCVRDYGWLRDCCCCFIGTVWLRYVVRTTDGRLRDCCCCFIGAVWLRSVFGTMGDCVTAASSGPYDCVVLSGLWATAWLLLLLHWGRMTAFCVRDYGRLRDCCCCFIGTVWLRYVVRTTDGRLRDCCCCFIGAVWLRSVFGTMGDCVTAAAASSGPYDGVQCSEPLWPTAWLLLLLHWGRMTALCCLDYGRLRDCCCCFIGAVWLRCVVRTMGDCVTAAAASINWGRMTAICCLDYGRLRDCCCCFIGAVSLRSVFGTRTAAAASLGSYDGVQCSGLWATAWLLLLLHWGRMTAICWLDYGRLRDCCCCLWCIGNARQDRPPLWGWCCWHRHRGRLAPQLVANRCAHCVTAAAVIVGTAWRSCVVRKSWKHREGRSDCVSDAAACLGQPVCSLLSGLRDWCCCCTRGGAGRVSWWQLHRCKTAADALCLLKCSACCCSLVFANLVELSCTQIWCRFIMTDWPYLALLSGSLVWSCCRAWTVETV